MSNDDSVTRWIDNLKAGDAAAAERLWERYFRRLVGFARLKLGDSPCRLASEEDVALSAFKSLCLGAEKGRFPQLVDRDNLWPLLVVLTSRKAYDLRTHEGRQKRGGGRVLNETDLAQNENGFAPLESILSREPSPEFSASMAEECERLLQILDETAHRVAVAKMEGFTNIEIAGQLGIAPRSVERKLQLIRCTWEASRPGNSDG